MNYDVAIIGGGLAGLSFSIDLKNRGYLVVVIEMNHYPRHKVCGEYISMESHHYLKSICPALYELDLPYIKNFKLSSTNKNEFNTTLDMGGFGISRYLLEILLFEQAQKKGVVFKLKSKALDIQFDNTKNITHIKTNTGTIDSMLVCNSTGRNSNLESKQKLDHINTTNYVGVKYHVILKRDKSLIEIHNFPGGYCGISNIEENKSCLCYIVNSKKLNHVGNSIPEMEKVFLYKNKNLKEIFTKAQFVFKKPITVSGINFLIKKPISNQSFFLGDSAGTMAPIIGNGMSMGLRSAFVLANNIDEYFSKLISREQMYDRYTKFWKKEFSNRIKLSRHLQMLSESPFLTKRTIDVFNLFPFLAKSIIRKTHGSSF